MRDEAAALDREDEAGRRLLRAALVRRRPLQGVERAVDLDRGHPRGDVLQLAALGQPGRVEVTPPARVAPAGDPDVRLRHVTTVRRGPGPTSGQARTTSTPRSRRAAQSRTGARPVGDEHVDVGELGEAHRALHPELGGVGEHDGLLPGRDDRPLAGGLAVVGRREAVAERDPVGAQERHVDPELAQRGHRRLADRGLGGRTDLPRQQVQLDLRHAGQSGGHGDGVGHHGQVPPGHVPAEAGGRGAGIDHHRAARGRQVLGGGRGDPVLLRGLRPVPLADRPLQRGDRRDRDGAAVHPAQHPGPLEDREVTAHGLGRHAVRRRQVEHREPPARQHELGDRLLALLGVHHVAPR